jgi:hypothetical protein
MNRVKFFIWSATRAAPARVAWVAFWLALLPLGVFEVDRFRVCDSALVGKTIKQKMATR